MKRAILIGAVLVAVLLAGSLLALRGRTFVIALTESQIQDKLDERFPIEKSYLVLLRLTLSNPKVNLREGSDRILFGAQASAGLHVPGRNETLNGEALVSTGLHYDADDHAFYLDDPRIESLQIRDVPAEHLDRINELALALAQDRINRTPIYKLDRSDLKSVAARLILKDMTVRNGRLVITLGL